MYRLPSRRKTKRETQKPSLIPILDAVFIFIFFLLSSASFIKIYEIQSDVPIVSNSPPPKDQKDPLGLTLRIEPARISLFAGVPQRRLRSFGKDAEGEYDLQSLHEYLIELKKNNKDENAIIFEPQIDLEYDKIVRIMDAVRMLKNTDPAIYREVDGEDFRVRRLFNKIIFGNIRSKLVGK